MSAMYNVKFTIVYSNGQRSRSERHISMDYPSESAAISYLRGTHGYPDDADFIIESISLV